MKLLFLHGYQQSPAIIQEETGFLQQFLTQALEEEVELVYPSAPFPSAPRSKDEPTFTWWPEDGSEEYMRTFTYLSDYLDQEGPFDGAIGFSQGACVSTLLAALLEQSSAQRPHNFTTNCAPLKFVISFSGYREDDERLTKYYEPGINTPILHFINSTDPIMPEDRCLRLVDCCIDTDGRVVIYSGSGNHRVPGTKMTKMALKRFLADFIE